MEKNEIKKLLYKQKPEAELLYIRKGVAYYNTRISTEGNPISQTMGVFFEVPISDMGEADFLSKMPAQILSRWIV